MVRRVESSAFGLSEEETLTIEQWQLITRHWNPFWKDLTCILRAIPQEERQRDSRKMKISLLSVESSEDRLQLRMAADIGALSDEILDRVIASFPVDG